MVSGCQIKAKHVMRMNREGDIRFGKNYVNEIKALGHFIYEN